MSSTFSLSMLLINLDATNNLNSLLREMLNVLSSKELKANATTSLNKSSLIFWEVNDRDSFFGSFTNYESFCLSVNYNKRKVERDNIVIMVDFELRSFVCEPLRGEVVVLGSLVSFLTWFAQHLHYISVIYFIKKVLKVTTIFLLPPHIFVIQSMLTNYLFCERLMTYNFSQFISLILEKSII